MSEQTQVAKRDDDMMRLRKQIEQQVPEFAKILPAHIEPQKFTRVLQTAIQRDPDLMQASRKSLFESCMKCAEDGLFPDGREAALAIFKVKMRTDQGDQWMPTVTYLPMVYGIRKKVYQSGEIKSLNARVVYENDDFDYSLGTEEWIRHKPALVGRGKMVSVYAVATYRDGATEFDVLTIEDVEKVRRVSRSPDKGPWSSWYDEMAKKTAIRRLAKTLPLSAEIRRVVERDDQLIDLTRSQPRNEVQGPEQPVRQALPANTTPRSLDDFAASQQTEPAAGEPTPAVADPEPSAEAKPSDGAERGESVPDDRASSGADADNPDRKAGYSAGLQGKTRRSMPAEVRDDEARADAWRRGLEAGLKARGQSTESEAAEV